MFEWLKKLFRKKPPICGKCGTSMIHSNGHSSAWYCPKCASFEREEKDLEEEVRKKFKQQLEKFKPKPEEGSLWTKDAYGWKQLEKVKEEQVRKQFLPEPQIHRRTTSHSYVAPAERHREAISKAMKGKASSRYLKTIKKSPKIKIEEED